MASDLSALGDLIIQVGGDISPLEQALDAAAPAAQQAAVSINDAFAQTAGVDKLTQSAETAQEVLASLPDGLFNVGSAMTATEAAAQKSADAFAEVDQAVQQAAQALPAVTSAAADTSKSLDEVTDSEARSGQAATEAKTPLEDFSNSLSRMRELAEAFIAITLAEKLQEFASEAVDAYGEAQRVQTSFELMSGSASTASTAMEDLEQMAVKLGIPLSEVERSAQQASVAFGVGEGLTSALEAAANASAVTGQSFDSVVQALSRVEQTGMLSTRQIVQMGLSWADVAKQMGVSVSEAQALMKSGGQSAEADVAALVATINAKFGQAAETQAQGVVAQITAFKNQVELVMESLGEAIAPALKIILDAFENTIIPAVNTLLAAFKALPEPLQNFTVLAGALALALVPIAASIPIIVAAVQGLATVLEGTATLFGAETGEMVANTAATEADTAATVELAVAKTAAGNVSAVAAGKIGAVAAAETDVAAGGAEASTALGTLGTVIGTATLAFGSLGLAMLVTGQNIKDLKEKYGDLDNEIRTHQILDALNAGDTIQQLEKLGYTLEQVKGAVSGFGTVGANVFQKLAVTQGSVIDGLEKMGYSEDQIAEKLKGVQSGALTAFQAIKDGATLPQLEDAGFKMDTLSAKLNSLAVAGKNAFAGVASGITVVDASFPKVQAAVTDLATHVADLQTKVLVAKAALDQLKATSDGSKSSMDLIAAATQNYQKAVSNLDSALGSAKTSQGDFIIGLTSMSEKTEAATADWQAAYGALQRADQAFKDGTIDLNTYNAMWDQASRAAKAAGQSISDTAHSVAVATQNASAQIANIKSLEDTYANLSDKLAALKAIGADTTTTQLALYDVFNKIKSALGALGLVVEDVDGKLEVTVGDSAKSSDALTGLAAKLSTGHAAAKQFSGGLQDLIDAQGQLSTEVTRATYVYNEALVKYGQGLIQYPVLAAALRNMEAAQKALNDSLGNSSQLYDASATKIIGLTGAVTTVTDAMRGIHSATEVASGDVQSLGDAAQYAAQHGVTLQEAIDELKTSTQNAIGATLDDAKAQQDLAAAYGAVAQQAGNAATAETNAAGASSRGARGARGGAGATTGSILGNSNTPMSQDTFATNPDFAGFGQSQQGVQGVDLGTTSGLSYLLSVLAAANSPATAPYVTADTSAITNAILAMQPGLVTSGAGTEFTDASAQIAAAQQSFTAAIQAQISQYQQNQQAAQQAAQAQQQLAQAATAAQQAYVQELNLQSKGLATQADVDSAAQAMQQALVAAGEALNTTAQKATDLSTTLAVAGPQYTDASNAAVNAINSGTAAVLNQAAAVQTLTSATSQAAMQITSSSLTIGAATNALLPTIATAVQASSDAQQMMSGLISVAPGGGGNIDLSSGTWTPGGTAPLQLTINLQAGVVAGQNGMQQLAQMVQQASVQGLKQIVGVKLF